MNQELPEVGLEDLQESMSRALGIAVMVAHPDGRALTEPSNLCSFCAMLNGVPEGLARCTASRTASAQAAAAAEREILYTCHAGLVHLAVPVRVGGETVAVMLGGNVTLEPPPREAVVRLAREVGLDPEELLAAAAEVPVWTEDRLRTVMGAVAKVALIVARLLHTRRELERKADELEALLQFSQTVSSSLDVGEVARRALRAVLELTGASSGSVVMLGEAPQRRATAEVAATQEPCEELRVVPSGEIVATVERESRSVQFNSRPGGATPEERRPAVSLPLMVGGRVTGVLTIAGRPEGAGFSDEEVAFLSTLGGSLGLALENARLFRQLQLRVRMLERLIDVGRVLSGSLDADRVIESAVASIRHALGVECCVLWLLDEDTGELVMKGSTGVGPKLGAEAVRVSPQATLLEKVLETGEPTMVEDVKLNTSGRQLPWCPADMRAVAVVPIRVGGKVVGVLQVHSPGPRRWSDEEIGYVEVVASQTGLALENARLYSSLRQAYLGAVRALAAALEAKDLYTRGHSVRVARWARACARLLGLSPEQQEQVYLAGLLHDVGKIGVREEILLKPGRLDEQERREIQGHPVVGARILEPASFHPVVIEAVRHHHEDYDGGGYPAGLMGEEIPLLARIIRVADAYDAMTSARPYRGALSVEQAREELRRGAGSQFDPAVVEAFLRIPAEEIPEITATVTPFPLGEFAPWNDVEG